MRKPRKNLTPVKKVAIVQRHLIDHMPLSNLCAEYQLPSTLFYLWRKQFFESATAAFKRRNDNLKSQNLQTIVALREQLQRKNEVVAQNAPLSKAIPMLRIVEVQRIESPT